MYCVIQEIENKKANPYGSYKELKAYPTTWTIEGETKTNYSYQYAGERFERPIKKAYKISIHSSYRKDGKVRKRQWVICTIPYYNIIDYSTWIGEYTRGGLDGKLKEIGITEERLCELVYKKLDPIIEEIQKEFKKTEEYMISQKHKEIINKHNKDKEAFESVYGKDTYDYCYDVFGVLRNEEMLSNIKAQYEVKKEYERSYYENFKNNYSNYDFSSYLKTNSGNYTEEERKYLKEIYRAAAKNLHPDIKKDNGEGMKFLNKLKDEWGI